MSFELFRLFRLCQCRRRRPRQRPAFSLFGLKDAQKKNYDNFLIRPLLVDTENSSALMPNFSTSKKNAKFAL